MHPSQWGNFQFSVMQTIISNKENNKDKNLRYLLNVIFKELNIFDTCKLPFDSFIAQNIENSVKSYCVRSF